MTVPTILLNDGREIPQLGFGVFQIEPGDTAQAVKTALDLGYRHIDTAQMYGNEAEVAQGIADSGVPRDEIWVTSKLNNGFHEPDAARKAVDDSVEKLRGPIDLYLIHWPLPTLYGGDFVSTWKVLEEARAAGKLRSIGVSNFQVNHLQRLAQEATVVPAVNQIEVHPYFGNEEVRRHCGEHQIGVEAWSPIAQGKVLDDPTVTAVANRLGKSPAQVVLRWHVERGDIVFPKSVTPSRMEENFALFDFELTEEDLALISALDKGEAGRTGPNPDTFDYVPG
ncbi:2,5-diketo-D-gluconate reductase A [Kineococcus radiotolerans]|uniref:2,5-diketo-D-gluconate reductase A n=1 Tax=Kineococcus radiotolerans TaxID=131568 RepID=A0A7W4TIV7_KINRA|nr:aldo/keto reductase [Kineococcus radiotolerans]MBB2899705.1 2,5-diketo-D-gluconate reductase A [Kineococcus radiotolerans]